MQIFRSNNPIVVHKLKDKLILITAEELCERMIVSPNRTLVLVAVDGNKIVGHIVVVIGQHIKSAFILSGRIDKGVSAEYKEMAMNMVEKWCVDEFGIHEIRTDTKIKDKVFSRLFKGYNLYGHVMNKTF